MASSGPDMHAMFGQSVPFWICHVEPCCNCSPNQLSQKKEGWFTVVLCDPSFRILGTAAAISDVFGNFGMCHLVGERPSERHRERHWNDLLNIRIIYKFYISIYLHIFTGLDAFRTNQQPNYTRNHPKCIFWGWQIASGTVFVISATRPRPEWFPSRTMPLRAQDSSPCCATNARAQKMFGDRAIL